MRFWAFELLVNISVLAGAEAHFICSCIIITGPPISNTIFEEWNNSDAHDASIIDDGSTTSRFMMMRRIMAATKPPPLLHKNMKYSSRRMPELFADDERARGHITIGFSRTKRRRRRWLPTFINRRRFRFIYDELLSYRQYHITRTLSRGIATIYFVIISFRWRPRVDGRLFKLFQEHAAHLNITPLPSRMTMAAARLSGAEVPPHYAMRSAYARVSITEMMAWAISTPP